MTDMKPGSQWLLPVRFEDYAVPKVGRYILPNGMDVLLTGGDLAGIIPADRITELEAEVARLTATLVKIHDVLFAPSGADEYLLRQLVWAGLGVGATSSEKEVGDVATD